MLNDLNPTENVLDRLSDRTFAAEWIKAQDEEVHTLECRISKLEAALQECVGVLDCDDMKGVWTFLAVHGHVWRGPVVDMLKLRALLASAAAGSTVHPNTEQASV